MAMAQTMETVRHPFTSGSDVKRMLINGEWVRASSGKTFESRSPFLLLRCSSVDITLHIVR